jgi:hypothetical protein
MERWAEACWLYGACCAAIRWADAGLIQFRNILAAAAPNAQERPARIRTKARVLARGRTRKIRIVKS